MAGDYPREIAIVSGKGGTGKTSIAGALAVLAGRGAAGGQAVLADCDVDAANLALILRATRRETHEFTGAPRAAIDPELCSGCGVCVEACRSGALRPGEAPASAIPEEPATSAHPGKPVPPVVDSLACEGCGICRHVCPQGAIRMVETRGGCWYVSDTPHGPLVHARLDPGGENSGKLVTLVREEARKLALATGRHYLLIDGPPGIGCPVLATLAGVDDALVVTEPTVTALHDLERILAVCRHFKVPAAVVINRSDLDEANTDRIEDRCAAAGVPVLARIPYDPAVTRAMVEGHTVVEGAGGKASRHIRRLWDRLAGLA